MEESHLVKLVRPFVGGKRTEITSTPKMFFLDNGLRNFLFGGFTAVNQRADCGALVENLVFAELDSDRGNDSLRKTKYIVNLKPNIFTLFPLEEDLNLELSIQIICNFNWLKTWYL
jgi:predicted AAA+ superfamily ATPase